MINLTMITRTSVASFRAYGGAVQVKEDGFSVRAGHVERDGASDTLYVRRVADDRLRVTMVSETVIDGRIKRLVTTEVITVPPALYVEAYRMAEAA